MPFHIYGERTTKVEKDEKDSVASLLGEWGERTKMGQRRL